MVKSLPQVKLAKVKLRTLTELSPFKRMPPIAEVVDDTVKKEAPAKKAAAKTSAKKTASKKKSS